jgi:hypothetical protein
MRDEKLSDAIVYDRLNLLKRDFCGYIGRNSPKIDANLVVFFGHVVSALENSFPGLSDDTHDEFLDAITFKVLDASQNGSDFEYIKKVASSARRLKKKPDGDVGINIVIGLKLLKIGDYERALQFLRNYWHRDTLIGTAVAYCYYFLSQSESPKVAPGSDIRRPNQNELLAREKLIDLARVQPPVNHLAQLQVEDPSFLQRIFWHMIHLGLEWFPSEKWFIEVGLRQATLTKNAEVRKELLAIGSERFYSDLDFLRELYYFKLENRDSAGAAHVVSQLITQYPNEPEPVYLGLKLSLLTTTKNAYHSFRKLAAARGIPPYTLELFDFAFDLMTNEKTDAVHRMAEFEKDYPRLQYYAIALRYISMDFSSADQSRVKKAKKALLDSVDQFCLQELNLKK